MAAASSFTCGLSVCPQVLRVASPTSFRRCRFSSKGCLIVCKSQRNSRYEKSGRHARQGHATIPAQQAVAPSQLRSGPAQGLQAKPKSGMEARKEKGTSHQGQGQQEKPEDTSFDPLEITAVGADREERPTAQEAEQEKSSGSHWDDFWAPRLFWVFRALGTVVD